MAQTVRAQFAQTMLDVGLVDPKLVVMVSDISHYALVPFSEACPGRFYNIGICEPTMVSMAAGLSKIGFYPVVHTIAPFLVERSFEQIKLDFCYQGLGGNVITVGSAFDYAALGCTHHCYGDFALIKTLPGSEIAYPATPVEFDTLFREVYQNDNLTMIRIPATPHEQDIPSKMIKLGKGIRIREGSDLTIIATGPQLDNAVAAQETLVAQGWDPEILYLHTIRPLDTELVRQSVSKTKTVVVIEEHMTSGGLGDDILRATRDISDVQFSSLSIPDTFVHEYGTYEDHCARLGLSSDGIIQRVGEIFQKTGA